MSNSSYSIQNLNSVYLIIDKIKAHYYQTLEGLKEIALGLSLENIVLDETYPYYDLGIRGVEFNEHKVPSCFYVSIDFLKNETHMTHFLSGKYKIIVIDYDNLNMDSIYYYHPNIEFIDIENNVGLIYFNYLKYRFVDFSYKKWTSLYKNNFGIRFINSNKVRFILKEEDFIDNRFEDVFDNLTAYLSTVIVNQSEPHEIQFYFNKSLNNVLLTHLLKSLILFFDNADNSLKSVLRTQLLFTVHGWNDLDIEESLKLDLLDRFIIDFLFYKGPLLWDLDTILNI